ncbi:hypothetical protein M1555_01165 [Patescibacteria group bacterium]|nr:hypothetical protein [Patescibacteria group bacterium]
MYRTITQLLDEGHSEYKTHEHKAVTTSREAADVRHTSLSAGAKAILLYGDGKPLMVVLPGDRKIDMHAFKKLYGIKDLRMATPDEVLRVTSVPIGAVPPFGHIFDVPLYMDDAVRKNDTIVFNAGLHTKSVSMAEKSYENVARPVVGSFSREAA